MAAAAGFRTGLLTGASYTGPVIASVQISFHAYPEKRGSALSIAWRSGASTATIVPPPTSPHEIDSPLLFLASAGSSCRTGRVLVIDGGWTAVPLGTTRAESAPIWPRSRRALLVIEGCIVVFVGGGREQTFGGCAVGSRVVHRSDSVLSPLASVTSSF